MEYFQLIQSNSLSLSLSPVEPFEVSSALAAKTQSPWSSHVISSSIKLYIYIHTCHRTLWQGYFTRILSCLLLFYEVIKRFINRYLNLNLFWLDIEVTCWTSGSLRSLLRDGGERYWTSNSLCISRKFSLFLFYDS